MLFNVYSSAVGIVQTGNNIVARKSFKTKKFTFWDNELGVWTDNLVDATRYDSEASTVYKTINCAQIEEKQGLLEHDYFVLREEEPVNVL